MTNIVEQPDVRVEEKKVFGAVKLNSWQGSDDRNV